MVESRVSWLLIRRAPQILLKWRCTWREEEEPEMDPIPEEMRVFLGSEGNSVRLDLCAERAVLREGLQPDLFPRVIQERERERERAM